MTGDVGALGTVATWPKHCGCRPGSHENGWREERCESCIKVEMDIWGQVIAWSRNGDIVKRIRERAARDGHAGATETPLGPNRARTSTDSTATLLGREQALSGEVSEQGDGKDAGE